MSAQPIKLLYFYSREFAFLCSYFRVNMSSVSFPASCLMSSRNSTAVNMTSCVIVTTSRRDAWRPFPIYSMTPHVRLCLRFCLWWTSWRCTSRSIVFSASLSMIFWGSSSQNVALLPRRDARLKFVNICLNVSGGLYWLNFQFVINVSTPIVQTLRVGCPSSCPVESPFTSEVFVYVFK